MRDIPGYEGLYGITSCGRVWSYRAKRFLKPFDNGKGYLRVSLRKDGKRKDFLVHRLVAETYLPNPDNLSQVNHKDEDKSNNALPNLEWCTAVYNINYSLAKKVICVETGKIFESVNEAAEAVNRNAKTLSNHLRGRKKTCAGLHFKY